MSENDLDRRIRAYFAARLHEHAAPDFESMLASTARRSRPRMPPWLVPALAASLLVGIALLRSDRDAAEPQATAELIAELSTSTHWTAPSDRWLGRQTPMPFRTLPDLDLMTSPPEDVKAWL
jgi:hypothetical protein